MTIIIVFESFVKNVKPENINTKQFRVHLTSFSHFKNCWKMLNENVTFYFYVKVILLRLCMHFGGGGFSVIFCVRLFYINYTVKSDSSLGTSSSCVERLC